MLYFFQRLKYLESLFYSLVKYILSSSLQEYIFYIFAKLILRIERDNAKTRGTNENYREMRD